MRTRRSYYGDSTTSGEEQKQNQDKENDQEMETEVDDILLEEPVLQLDQREEQLAIEPDMQQEVVTVSSRLKRKEKKLKLVKEKEDKCKQLELAAKDWMNGKFRSVRECARVHNVAYRTLHKGIVINAGMFKGSGKFSTILSREEEMLVKVYLYNMEKIEYG